MSPRLNAYFNRIGLTSVPTVDAAGLTAIHRAQRMAIPFENLDIPLGRGIDISADAVFAKLVEGGRGGYCFEQNGLFLRALLELGFTARPLLGRVWLQAETTPPLTHTLNLVTIDGVEWIADSGFGGNMTPPMRLIDGEYFATRDGVAHRLIRDGEGWMLERKEAPHRASPDKHGWQRQYHFTCRTVEGVDLQMSNHWTSTRPGVRFTSAQVVSRILPDAFASLVDGKLSVQRDGETENRMISDAADYGAVLRDIFGLAIDDAQADHLFHKLGDI